jgi:hypothetical protein
MQSLNRERGASTMHDAAACLAAEHLAQKPPVGIILAKDQKHPKRWALRVCMPYAYISIYAFPKLQISVMVVMPAA